MIPYRKLLFSTILLLSVFAVRAQHTHEVDEHSDAHKNHLGVGGAAAYLTSENVFAPGFHLHYIRQFGHEYKWGVGAGYEAIVDEHTHNGVNLFLNYRPISFISLVAGPGIVFGKHEGVSEIHPALHAEAVFEFDISGVHVGPMLGFGIDPEETHIAAGIHIGFGF
jgi:hypothetical protein